MVSVKHIQYPVGQGGLHLGIIKNYAYIYDCGGYRKCVDWDNIFDDVVKKLKIANCQNLDIFISHWHQDHCNKLEKLEGYLDKAKIKAVFKDGINPETGEILPSVYIEEVETVNIKINE